jgi:hypothetical protein
LETSRVTIPPDDDVVGEFGEGLDDLEGDYR